MARCIDCRYLAGSDRTPQWLFAESRGYCDHPDREGGPWNVLQCVTQDTRCERFEPADPERVRIRQRAIEILSARFNVRQTLPPAPLQRRPARGRR